jgi:hypothetical protein
MRKEFSRPTQGLPGMVACLAKFCEQDFAFLTWQVFKINQKFISSVESRHEDNCYH